MTTEDKLLASYPSLQRSVDAACTEMDRLRRSNRQMSELLLEFVQGERTFGNDGLPCWVIYRIEKAQKLLDELEN